MKKFALAIGIGIGVGLLFYYLLLVYIGYRWDAVSGQLH